MQTYLCVEGKEPGSFVGLSRRKVLFVIWRDEARKMYSAIESNVVMFVMFVHTKIFTPGPLPLTRLVASSQVTCTVININEPNGDKILNLKT